MNTFLKYVIGLDLLNCHAKCLGDTISRCRKNEVWSCYFGSFPDISERKLSLPSWVMEGGCDVARLYVLQSNRSCTIYKRKTRGETQFLIELAAPYTLANNNEMNSDDIFPFIIFLTPVSCDGSNRLWRRRLLPSPCPLWRHKQMLVGLIRPLAGKNAEGFAESLNDIFLIDIYAFTAYFSFRFFYIVLYD